MLANHSKDKSIVDKVFTVVAKAKKLKEEMCKMTEKEIMNKLEKHILDELNNK